MEWGDGDVQMDNLFLSIPSRCCKSQRVQKISATPDHESDTDDDEGDHPLVHLVKVTAQEKHVSIFVCTIEAVSAKNPQELRSVTCLGSPGQGL